MKDFLDWLNKGNGWGLVMGICLIILCVAAVFWAKSPSPWKNKQPSHYNECLQIVLGYKNNLNDAEAMCAPLRNKEVKSDE